ncbi:MAG TPA: hemolysin family protein [Trueperaceae bacterium]|nr:hemolysin family protein [Trueperaceae bacterium]
MDEPPSSPWRVARALTTLPLIHLTTTALAQGAGDGGLPDGIGAGRIGLAAAFLLVSAFASACQAALGSLSEWRLRQLWEGRDDGNGALALIERDPQRFVTTLLIARTATDVALTALLVVSAMQLAAGTSVSPWLATAYGGVASVLLLLVFAEIIPRSVALRDPVGLARAVVRPVYLLSVVVYPVGALFTYLTKGVLKLFRIETSLSAQMSEEELRQLLRSAGESGVLESEEQAMIRGVIDLEETVVREVMTPRVDVIGVSEDASLLELLALVREHGYSRLPVYAETIDNVRGVVYARDLLRYLEGSEALEGARVADLMTTVQFVPETLSVAALLRDMRSRKSHFAVVVDEFGGTAGVITLEDIIEEITGDIYDETDEDEEAEISALEGGAYRLLGAANLQDIGAALGIRFDEDGDYDTLAGFMIDELGHIPEPGEAVTLSGMRFEVEQADGRRVISVVATPVDPELEHALEEEAAAEAR